MRRSTTTALSERGYNFDHATNYPATARRSALLRWNSSYSAITLRPSRAVSASSGTLPASTSRKWRVDNVKLAPQSASRLWKAGLPHLDRA